MSVVSDIVAFHIRPRQIVRKRLAITSGDGEALFYLIVGCLFYFLAQLPEMVRFDLSATVDIPFHGVVAGRFIGVAVFAPILFYIISALTKLALSLTGLKISWINSRISLFWALLATTPAMLSLGIIRGLIPTDIVLWPATLVVGVLFLFFWIIGLIESLRKT